MNVYFRGKTGCSLVVTTNRRFDSAPSHEFHLNRVVSVHGNAGVSACQRRTQTTSATAMLEPSKVSKT
jgi:hypothetical protein